MVECFDRSAVSGAALASLVPAPTRVAGDEAGDWHEEDLLGEQSHAYFRLHRLVVHGSVAWPHEGVYAVVIVTAGQGLAETSHGQMPLARGDTLAILAGTAPSVISGDLTLVVATPSLG
jgi:mannose-6-phosphate isomerase class I